MGGIDQRRVGEQMLDGFMEATKGRPQAVAAICDELMRPVQNAISDALERSPLSAAVTPSLDRSLTSTARQLVAETCQEVLGRDLPIVMDLLVVLRHVNAGLLGRALQEEGITPDQADLLTARLAGYSIMTTSDDAQAESFRLHERIRQYCLSEMPAPTVRRAPRARGKRLRRDGRRV